LKWKVTNAFSSFILVEARLADTLVRSNSIDAARTGLWTVRYTQFTLVHIYNHQRTFFTSSNLIMRITTTFASTFIIMLSIFGKINFKVDKLFTHIFLQTDLNFRYQWKSKLIFLSNSIFLNNLINILFVNIILLNQNIMIHNASEGGSGARKP